MEDKSNNENDATPTTEGGRTLNEMGVKDKIKYVFNNITIEPLVTLYVAPSVLTYIPNSNLKLLKACRVNLNLTEEVCQEVMTKSQFSMTNGSVFAYAEQEKMTQQLVTDMDAWVSIVKNSLPIVLLMFIGSWSDRNRRRKPCLLMPFIGDLLSTLGFLLCVYYFLQLPMEVTGFFDAIFPAFSGGITLMLMAIFSYIADITTVEDRTFRIGVITFIQTFFNFVVQFVTGYLYQGIGFYGVYSIVAVLYLTGILYCTLYVKESRKPKPLPKNYVKDFFDPTHVVETCNVVYKKREGRQRFKIILVLLLTVTMCAPVVGEGGVGYFYVRLVLNWNEVDFSIYSSYTIILNLLGTMIVIGVFSNMMKLDDALIGLIACITKIVTCIMYTFWPSPFMFYAGAWIEMISNTGMIAIRSITSKLVPSDELGKLNSFSSIVIGVVQLVFPSLYFKLYSNTVDFLPGTFFLLSTVITIFAAVAHIYLYIFNRQERATENTNANISKATNSEELNKGVENEAFEENGKNNPTNVHQTKL